MTLAWTPGPKAPRDIVLLWGDSNADGKSDAAGAPVGYPPASLLYMCKTAAAGQVVLAEPCGQAAAASSGMGPGGLFGWRMTLATGRECCVINAGVGSSTSAQWVPGQANYAAAVGRLQRALSRRDTTIRAILVYIGLNNAILGSPPDLTANVQATLAGLRAIAGKTAAQLPAAISRLPADVPTDQAYPSHATVQTQINALADANHLLITPPTPADRPSDNGVHHGPTQNDTIAQQWLTALMGHASWA